MNMNEKHSTFFSYSIRIFFLWYSANFIFSRIYDVYLIFDEDFFRLQTMQESSTHYSYVLGNNQ